MKVMYSGLFGDKLIIIDRRARSCVFATGFSGGLFCGPSPWDAAYFTV